MIGAWTEDQDAILRKRWAEGISASDIANEIGDGRTRNAVIGRVHRLNLSGRAKPSGPRKPRERKPRTRTIEINKKSKPLPKPDPLQFVKPLNGTGVPFLSRDLLQCSWIVDDQNNVCGHPISNAVFTWCPFHCEIGLVKPVRPERRDVINRHKTNEGAF